MAVKVIFRCGAQEQTAYSLKYEIASSHETNILSALSLAHNPNLLW